MPRTVGPVVQPGSLSAGPQPELTTAGGLLLRPWRPDDADDVAAVLTAFADPEIQRWGVRHIVTAAQANAWLRGWTAAWIAETDACWAVAGADGVVGRVALRRLDLAGGIAELAYWVLPAARRRGVASDAGAEASRWAVEELGLHRLELCHSVHNPGSCAVARRLGYALEGTQRDAMLHVDGWHDMHLHALLRGRAVGGTN
ncbi:GNAT family N-acetyltransferase [Pengzhenrongella sicca]|uniref:GNAT family N-acetyltransferase n=1 Tax=Pengzhenrongella sicca TaxID=2819238 RepID=A0A8A4ZGG2_9MICO|nr:GNAT family N-acetyltransferase [Pengzhenrongella sicca]QTE31130.1 GNAT family N-acetyltransferase [Pengzhenrongella sicca]